MSYTICLERMHYCWGFMSVLSSKYGKDASLLGPYTPAVSMERMHHYWGFMSIYSSKYGKDASLLGLHVHTLQ